MKAPLLLLAMGLTVVMAGQAEAQASQTAPSACKGLAAAYDDGLKELSEQAWTTSARSAPQATQLATEQANTLSLMQMNLTLMVSNRCPMPTRPANTSTYMLPALQCATASLGNDEAVRKARCDRTKWTPEGFPDAKP